MKVLMFGWEFPPFFAGGVGVVCHELVKQLTAKGVQVDYVMPHAPDVGNWQNLRMLDASKSVSEGVAEAANPNLNISKVQSLLAAYQTPEEYEKTLLELKEMGGFGPTPAQDKTHKLYGDDLIHEIELFAKRVAYMAQHNHFNDFDVIHAHDWTTVPAATAVKRLTGKPMVVHVHITEINKNAGQGVNPHVYDIERQGFFAADKILAVSGAIKQTLIDHYGVPADKIDVVHNANIAMDPVRHTGGEFKGDNKIVSFLGRVTTQKGPLHFVEMAAQVLRFCPNTKFIMGGTGDLLQSCIDRTRELGIYDKFYFHGFYNREAANRFYDISDVFVLPSLMEPFGVTPLEAMCKETPTIVTKQSGVAEIIDHCYKVDFWDINKMASQVVNLLKFPRLHKHMKANGFKEATQITWEKPAQLCMNTYQELAH